MEKSKKEGCFIVVHTGVGRKGIKKEVKDLIEGSLREGRKWLYKGALAIDVVV